MDELPTDLFGDTARAVLRQSILDLEHPNELREMGMALYLDRPMGLWKARGEQDQTPMLAYEAFSRGIAAQRLLALAKDTDLLPDTELTALRGSLDSLPVAGVPLAEVGSVERPGVVSLADAGKAAPDFILVRTTESSAVWGFYDLFQFLTLSRRFEITPLLGIPGYPKVPSLILGRMGADGEIVLTVHEAGSLRKRLELSVNPRDGYVCRAGVEYPRKGLRVRRVWADDGGTWREHDLTAEELFLPPR
jgi:hypothetical protein